MTLHNLYLLGDSVVIAPPQTLNDADYYTLRSNSSHYHPMR